MCSLHSFSTQQCEYMELRSDKANNRGMPEGDDTRPPFLASPGKSPSFGECRPQRRDSVPFSLEELCPPHIVFPSADF